MEKILTETLEIIYVPYASWLIYMLTGIYLFIICTVQQYHNCTDSVFCLIPIKRNASLTFSSEIVLVYFGLIKVDNGEKWDFIKEQEAFI